MKSTKLTRLAVIATCAVLTIPTLTSAQEQAKQDHHLKHHHYKLIDMGTFGGPSSWLATTNEVTSPGGINQVLNKNEYDP